MLPQKYIENNITQKIIDVPYTTPLVLANSLRYILIFDHTTLLSIRVYAFSTDQWVEYSAKLTSCDLRKYLSGLLIFIFTSVPALR